MNAFDETMIEELTQVFTHLASDAATRVIVLAAAGKVFCAGADLRWMERQSQHGPADNLADAQRFAHMMRLIYECPKPVIARVQGSAYGGGVGLLCACDIVVASAQARFVISEAKFGILPAVISPYVTNAIGKRHAARLALTAELFDAAFAEKIGLVHEVVDADGLDAAVEKFVAQMLANGPLALGEIKHLFQYLSVGPIDETVRQHTAHTIARLRATPEAKEGFAAFLGKRAPTWQNK
jgi:methylglutaconyl-CoA hydratase